MSSDYEGRAEIAAGRAKRAERVQGLRIGGAAPARPPDIEPQTHETPAGTGARDGNTAETERKLMNVPATAVACLDNDQCEPASPDEFDVVDTAKRIIDDAKAPRITLTRFGGVNAKAGERVPMTWLRARAFVANAQTYPSKGACPMFRSGLSPDDSRATGHEPITEWTALVVEHDAETVSMAAAATLLREAGVAALMFTSASHMTVGKSSCGGPRWRVIMPLSRPVVDAAEYERLVRCVNGLLQGCVAPESAETTRCWYYGRVKGVPYEYEVVDGACIDDLDRLFDLDETPLMGRAARASGTTSASREVPADLGFERDISLGEVAEKTMLELKFALDVLSSDDRKVWVDATHALKALEETEHGARAHSLWLDWIQKSTEFKPGDESKWDDCKPNRITHKSIFAWSDEVDASWRDRAAAEWAISADALPIDAVVGLDEPVAEALTPPRPAQKGACVFPDPFPGPMAAAVAAALPVAPKPQPELTTLAVLTGMAAGVPGGYRLPDGMRMNLYGVGILGTGGGKDLPRRVGMDIARAAGAKLTGRPASGAGLEDALVVDRGLLCEMDEFGHVMAAGNQVGAPGYAIDINRAMLALYSASAGSYSMRLVAKTKENASTPKVLDHPTLSVLAFTTPEVLGEAMGAANVVDGLAGRFLYARGREGVEQRRPKGAFSMPPIVADRAAGIQQALKGLEFHGAAELTVHIDQDADALLEQLMRRFDQQANRSQVSGFGKALLQRSFEKASRIAGVLAVWDDPESPVVRVAHVRWAEAFVEASNHAAVTFVESFMHGGRVQANAARVVDVLQRVLSGELSVDRANEARAVKSGWVPQSLVLRRTKLAAKDLQDAMQHLRMAGQLVLGGQTADGAKGGARTMVLMKLAED